MADTLHRVVMDCHHALEFTTPPFLGEDIYCPRCQRMREVTEAPPEFRIRCMRCSYGKRTGAARLDAELSAMRHRQRKPGHPVRIYDGTRLIYTMGNRPEATLPLAVDDAGNLTLDLPPF